MIITEPYYSKQVPSPERRPWAELTRLQTVAGWGESGQEGDQPGEIVVIQRRERLGQRDTGKGSLCLKKGMRF